MLRFSCRSSSEHDFRPRAFYRALAAFSFQDEAKLAKRGLRRPPSERATKPIADESENEELSVAANLERIKELRAKVAAQEQEVKQLRLEIELLKAQIAARNH